MEADAVYVHTIYPTSRSGGDAELSPRRNIIYGEPDDWVDSAIEEGIYSPFADLIYTGKRRSNYYRDSIDDYDGVYHDVDAVRFILLLRESRL